MAVTEEGIGEEEVDELVNLDGFAGSGLDGAAVGTEKGVGVLGMVEGAEEGGASDGDDGAVVIIEGFEVLAAVNAAGMKGEDAVGVETGHPGGMGFADGTEAADGIAAGGLKNGDGAINDAVGTNGDVSVKNDDGVGAKGGGLDGFQGVKKNVLDGGVGGGEVRGAVDGGETGGEGEVKNLGRIRGNDGPGEKARGAGVVEGVGDDGPAEKGEEVLVLEAETAGTGENDAEDVHEAPDETTRKIIGRRGSGTSAGKAEGRLARGRAGRGGSGAVPFAAALAEGMVG
jgi:hypothetical protein